MYDCVLYICIIISELDASCTLQLRVWIFFFFLFNFSIINVILWNVRIMLIINFMIIINDHVQRLM